MIVDGVNLVKKHVKPNPMKGTTGGIVEKAMPIHQSNVAIFKCSSDRQGRSRGHQGERRRHVFACSSPMALKSPPKGNMARLQNSIAKRSRLN